MASRSAWELGTADALGANGDSPPPTRRSANNSTASAPKNSSSIQVSWDGPSSVSAFIAASCGALADQLTSVQPNAPISTSSAQAA